MTMTIDLPSQVEQAYREIATAKGVPVDTLVLEAVIVGYRQVAHAKPHENLESHSGESLTLTNAERRKLTGRKSLVELFAESPLKGLELDFSRNRSSGRPLDLG